ncbi:MAG: hypothetical protein JWN85_3137 [Gammaproteobacteria bacterium]|nr:hypothetical protein [Gammaproteobacteria bacterium]
MEGMLENVVVGVIVAGSAIFSAWRLLSARLRLRLLDFVAPLLEKIAGPAVARLRSRTLQQLGGACGACSSNKTAAHRPSTPRR